MNPAARAWRNIFFLSPSVDSAIASALCSISVVSDCRVFERGAALFRKSKRFSGWRGRGEGDNGDFRVGFSSGLVFAFRETSRAVLGGLYNVMLVSKRISSSEGNMYVHFSPLGKFRRNFCKRSFPTTDIILLLLK